VSALLALALAAAPGCPAALATAAVLPADALAARAPALARELEDAGAGPAAGLAAAARELAASPGAAQEAAAAAFRGALATHCALAAAPPAPEASAVDRAALAEVLARPELSQLRLDPWAIRRALVSFWDWLVELLGTEEAERYASLGRALFLGAAAGALALAVAALRRRGRAPGAGSRPEEAPGPAAAAPDASAERAEEALRRGETRDAVRLALLAALGALERAGRVPRGRSLTNAEVVRAAARSTRTAASPPGPPPAGGDLALLARTFDRAVYGGFPVTPEEARGAVERARRVVAAAGGTP
jgi:hypothetical protein